MVKKLIKNVVNKIKKSIKFVKNNWRDIIVVIATMIGGGIVTLITLTSLIRSKYYKALLFPIYNETEKSSGIQAEYCSRLLEHLYGAKCLYNNPNGITKLVDELIESRDRVFN